ncbi:hypothetical protein, partial [Escherichia coli]|uniref:hypothetical protein n=1 Tax=Escherichia coli TaxID=562 RepID=UPI001BDBC011
MEQLLLECVYRLESDREFFPIIHGKESRAAGTHLVCQAGIAPAVSNANGSLGTMTNRGKGWASWLIRCCVRQRGFCLLRSTR